MVQSMGATRKHHLRDKQCPQCWRKGKRPLAVGFGRKAIQQRFELTNGHWIYIASVQRRQPAHVAPPIGI
jgi:hypothetical protein